MSDNNVEEKKKDRYHNPDEIKFKKKDRSVIVRFRNEKDMADFVEKTGIEINPKIKTLKYPVVDITSILFG
jgi:hypothetical protein